MIFSHYSGGWADIFFELFCTDFLQARRAVKMLVSPLAAKK